MATAYLTLKTIHIVGIISWMAGLLYYFRLLIYHFEYGQKNQSIHDLLSLMERRLFRFITVPAMILSVFSGISIVVLRQDLLFQRWFQTKALCGLFMVFFTIYGGTFLKKFSNHQVLELSSKRLRILNEVPTALMILIVFLVIFRP